MNDIFKKAIAWLLKIEARVVLHKYRPRIIAVTGSVGKTSTKDAIFAVLSPGMHVRGSQKSFNSEIGLPLTILGRPNAWKNPLRWLQNLLDGLFLIIFPARYPRWLVLEVGADEQGDISSLASWLSVDVAVITRLPEVPVHVEFFDSVEAVIEEKASLINALKHDGTLVVYKDDMHTKMLLERAHARGAHTITFGLHRGADVWMRDMHLAREASARFPSGMNAEVVSNSGASERAARVELSGVAGAHAFLPVVAAVAVGQALGLSLEESARNVGTYEPPEGRMHLIEGIKNSLLIDDTYNSSPAAVVAALDTLQSVGKASRKPARTIAVLADMLELGRRSTEEHRKIGAHVANTANILVAVGFRSRQIAESALDNGMRDEQILQYEDASAALIELPNIIEAGDIVLIKGSQSMRMERVTKALMRDPELAPKLLVRQDEEWKKR